MLKEDPPLTMADLDDLEDALTSLDLVDIICRNCIDMYYSKAAWKIDPTKIKMLGLDGLEPDSVTGLLHFPQEEPVSKDNLLFCFSEISNKTSVVCVNTVSSLMRKSKILHLAALI